MVVCMMTDFTKMFFIRFTTLIHIHGYSKLCHFCGNYENLRNFYQNYEKFQKFKEKFLEILKVKIMKILRMFRYRKLCRKSFVKIFRYFRGKYENFMWKF